MENEEIRKEIKDAASNHHLVDVSIRGQKITAKVNFEGTLDIKELPDELVADGVQVGNGFAKVFISEVEDDAV